RALTATLQPISPSPSAICRPRPREPPVTRATLPARSKRLRVVISAASLNPGRTVEGVHGLGVLHRAGAPCGKAVAGEVDHVDVGGARGDSLGEDLRALGCERARAATDDLL